MRDEPDRHVCVGKMLGGFGVKGEVRIQSFCEEPGDIARYSPLSDEGEGQFHLTALRKLKMGFAARFDEITSREEADALKGVMLYASRAQFPVAGAEEFYHSDLIGLVALDQDGEELGRVKALHNFGAGDLVEIKTIKGAFLLPFTKTNIPSVDIEGGHITIDPPKGLLDTPAESEDKPTALEAKS